MSKTIFLRIFILIFIYYFFSNTSVFSSDQISGFSSYEIRQLEKVKFKMILAKKILKNYGINFTLNSCVIKKPTKKYVENLIALNSIFDSQNQILSKINHIKTSSTIPIPKTVSKHSSNIITAILEQVNFLSILLFISIILFQIIQKHHKHNSNIHIIEKELEIVKIENEKLLKYRDHANKILLEIYDRLRMKNEKIIVLENYKNSLENRIQNIIKQNTEAKFDLIDENYELKERLVYGALKLFNIYKKIYAK